jgi:hypothetical protein
MFAAQPNAPKQSTQTTLTAETHEQSGSTRARL